ncbi:MarR family winged helix-turn-helix transcriptional regulator [Amycolatopsis acidicola]|uniref:MarR family winged helix-turn-helix transcriptional regulator n=1 Tax=Amycolatopsis acidicola TaxID=2596893 RepID=UPI001FB85885|nr:MarR family transcriptional regulator [Amycolatopsis acidicola]
MSGSLPEARTAYLLKQLELALRARLDAAVRPHGLTVVQYTALTELSRDPGISAAELARRSFVSAQTMQELIARLEQQGLVQRVPAEHNKRVLETTLTERGERTLHASDHEVDEIEQDMLSDFDTEAVEALRQALRSCTKRVRKGA